tara:strand:- start:14 stop:679 length:666 start_codon:yes stop_codon:yes gene_type:complete
MKLNNWIIVFDLDDTLFSEREYFFSGISYVEEFISDLYKVPFYGEILKAHKKGVKDLWGWSSKKLGLPLAAKESFLWLYRNHKPKINLFPGIVDLINELNKLDSKVLILTDGRSVSQRLKIEALNLNRLPVFISEEYSSIKPNKKRFLYIQNTWKGSKFVYIGDNANKDFIAPKDLNWLCIGADWCKEKIHNDSNNEKLTQPKIWLKKPIDVIKILKQEII